MTSQSAVDAQPSLLFTPITLRGVTARNRIVVSPMCQYVSVDGGPTDWHLVHFGRSRWAAPASCSARKPRSRRAAARPITAPASGTTTRSNAYRRITDFIKQMGAVPAIQLGHCGRNAGSHGAMEDWRALDRTTTRGAAMPPWRGWRRARCRRGAAFRCRSRWIATTSAPCSRRIARRGAPRRPTPAYDICEIHGAHGYLIHQFLSPMSNRRTDGYGGDLARPHALCARDGGDGARRAGRRTSRCSSVSPRSMAKAGCGGSTTPSRWRANCGSAASTWSTARPAASSGDSRHGAGAARARLSSAVCQPRPARGRRHDHGGRSDHRSASGRSRAGDGHADLVAMARELMIHADWPLRAAKALNAGAIRSDGAVDSASPAAARRTGGRVPAGVCGRDTDHG